jgi:FixJ family two-component response regulator
MTGLALQDHLTAQGCRIPTILITACPTSSERQRAIAGGAVCYLAKPLSEQILLATVREALEHAAQAAGNSLPGQVAPGT